MNGAYRPFRVLKKRDTGVMYIAIPDLNAHFEEQRNNCQTIEEEAIWQGLIDSFTKIIYEGLDHDL